MFAWAADRRAVENLLRGTGSRIDRRGVDFYSRLLGNPAHVAGAIGMMANWDLSSFARELPSLKPRIMLVVGGEDKAVPPGDAAAFAKKVPGASVETIHHAGHLAHEEKPEEVADLILQEAVACGVIAAPKPAAHRRGKPPHDPLIKTS